MVNGMGSELEAELFGWSVCGSKFSSGDWQTVSEFGTFSSNFGEFLGLMAEVDAARGLVFRPGEKCGEVEGAIFREIGDLLGKASTKLPLL